MNACIEGKDIVCKCHKVSLCPACVRLDSQNKTKRQLCLCTAHETESGTHREHQIKLKSDECLYSSLCLCAACVRESRRCIEAGTFASDACVHLCVCVPPVRVTLEAALSSRLNQNKTNVCKTFFFCVACVRTSGRCIESSSRAMQNKANVCVRYSVSGFHSWEWEVSQVPNGTTTTQMFVTCFV